MDSIFQILAIIVILAYIRILDYNGRFIVIGLKLGIYLFISSYIHKFGERHLSEIVLFQGPMSPKLWILKFCLPIGSCSAYTTGTV